MLEHSRRETADGKVIAFDIVFLKMTIG